MMIVWKLGEKITTVLCCIVYDDMWTVLKFASWFGFHFCLFV